MSESTIIGFNESRKWKSLSGDSADDFLSERPPSSKTQEFKFRIASSDTRRTAATVLVRKMYSWRGYETQGASPKKPDELVLIAESAGEPVATMTVCLDGASGLPADENFRTEMDAMRASGLRLWEASRVAVVSRMPKRIFAGLIHMGIMYSAMVRDCTHAIIEVNPRHVRFYIEMMGFKHVGAEAQCTRVGAPAVLLRLDMAHALEKIHKYANDGEKNSSDAERTFYSYFFTKKDVPGILNRLSNECL